MYSSILRLKEYYTAQQRKEKVEIVYQDYGTFKKWSFAVADSQKRRGTIFAYKYRTGEDGYILETPEADFEFQDLQELEFQAKKLLEERILLLNKK